MWTEIALVAGFAAVVLWLNMKNRGYKQEKNESSNFNTILLPQNTTQFSFYFHVLSEKAWLKLTEKQLCNVVGDVLVKFSKNFITLLQYDNVSNNYVLQSISDENYNRNDDDLIQYLFKMDNGTVTIVKEYGSGESKVVFQGTCGVTKSNRMIGPFNYLQYDKSVSVIGH